MPSLTLGIFGYPLAHSLSPLMYETAIEHLHLSFRFQLYEVRPQDLPAAVQEIRTPGVHGVCVTIPHKETIAPLLDGLSEEAQRVGAVNLVHRDGDRLLGHNTDGIGFLRSLREEGRLDPRDRRVLLLGAGGAARAVASQLSQERVLSLTIANRTLARAQALAAQVEELSPGVKVQAVSLRGPEVAQAAKEADLIVNTTSLGLAHLKGGDDALPLSPQHIRPTQVVMDLVYNPLETSLLRLAGERGARTLGGLGMLIYQGAENFRIWTGSELPVELVRPRMEAALKEAAHGA